MTNISILIHKVCVCLIEFNLIASSNAKPTTNTALSAALVFLIVSLSALLILCQRLPLPHIPPPSAHTINTSPSAHILLSRWCSPPNLWLGRSRCGQNKSVLLAHQSHHLIFCMSLFVCLCSFDVGGSCVVTRNWDDGERDAESHTQHLSDGWKLKREVLLTNYCVYDVEV